MAHAEHGNTKGIINVCIEFNLADRRLQQWSDWLHQESGLKSLGYPTSSAEQRIPGQGGTTKSGITNQDAEEIERLLSELKQQWYEVYQALMAYYFVQTVNRSKRYAADKNNISVATYQKYFNTGMGWMEGKLSK